MRTQSVCAEHRDRIEATPVGVEKFGQLDASVKDVKRLFAEQRSGHDDAQKGVTARRLARIALRKILRMIVRTSRVVADTGAGQAFEMPSFNSDEMLVADATMILSKASPLAGTFTAHGLPATVLADLPARIAAFEAAILAVANGRKRHVGANAVIDAALQEGDAAIEALETILFNATDQDPHVVATWNNAKRVGPSRVKEDAPAPPTPINPQPADKVA